MRRQAAMLYGCQHGLLRRPLWLRGVSQGHLSLHRRSVGWAKTIGKGTSRTSFIHSFIHSFSRLIQRLLVVGKRPLESQTKESARRDKRPSPGYCVAICFYYAALGHMFLLCGARPYVSIGWLWAWR